jgi:hypothetical protein
MLTFCFDKLPQGRSCERRDEYLYLEGFLLHYRNLLEFFSGEHHRKRYDISTRGFNDRTSSIIVRDGVWEACVDAYFQGGCIQLRPGEYPQLEGRFDRSISSLRVLSGRPYSEGYAAPDRRVARAILFEAPDFRGRSFPIRGAS